MVDVTKQNARHRAHDLFPGSHRCVRKTFSTYFVSASQWKITLISVVCFIGPEKPQRGEVNQVYITLDHLKSHDLAPVVQRVDSAIQWINYYPLDNAINFDSAYPLDSDLSNG